MSNKSKKTATIVWIIASLCACGTNVFKSQESKDPAEDATIDLENHDETSAIKILEGALASDPENAQLLSILALAYAQRAGIEPLQFAERMASNQSTGSASGSGSSTQEGDYTSMFSVMPEATAANLSDLDKACQILSTQIPADKAQPGDKFKLALYQAASFILHTKALDTNGDGQLTLDEILNLSTASAGDLLAQLAAATASFGGSSDSASQQSAGNALAKFQDKIDASPGDTSEERLKNYLASSGAASKSASEAAAAAAAGGTTGTTTDDAATP